MNWERMAGFFSTSYVPSLLEHIFITLLAIAVALIISVPLGIFLTRPRFRKYCDIASGIINILQTIPSLSLIALAMPVLGIGIKPTIMVLCLFSIMPILKNMLAGINNVDINYLEAVKGMGMSPRQILFKVELPLAMPVILTGVRTATVIVIAGATIAAVIGAGGLGEFIFLGLSMNWPEPLLLGGITCAVLASVADFLLAKLAVRFIPPGMIVEDI
ncbi:MAG: ABC transporter permease [Dehalobacterium sp.]